MGNQRLTNTDTPIIRQAGEVVSGISSAAKTTKDWLVGGVMSGISSIFV